MISQTDLKNMVAKIKTSRKYRGTGIPDETIEDVLKRELERHPKPADALHSAKAILHNIMAPYLGNADHSKAETAIEQACGSNDAQKIRQTCLAILSEHDSTRERMPYLGDFYRQIQAVCPNLKIILDLACGLNPFAFPWMGLPPDTRYHAYDIHQPRVALINRTFEGIGLAQLAERRDILIHPPEIQADAAFLFKEAHRMEKRRKGASRELVHALKARAIFISLPNRSLDGRRDLRTRMDALFNQMVDGLPGARGSAEFAGETLYWIVNENG